MFESSEVEERRQLIKLVLQNVRLDGKLVRFDGQKPFDTILNYNDNQLWLPAPELSIQQGFEAILKTFENVSYIGELRQRWLEIKKLQSGQFAEA